LPASPTALPAFDPGTFQLLLAQLKGTPVVVNVWASWCGPCIDEAPALATASETYRGRVQFLGVDIQDQMGPAKQFVERFGWTYPSVFDAPGAIRDSMGLIGQPQTVIFDAAGNRVCVRSGPADEQFLTETLDTVLSGLEVAPACTS
jgi:cytochrome c biogenesis protein CcmG, thiol:disulfide interchange protein DsbE